MITSRQLYREEPAPRPLMPARQAETPPAAPVKFATIERNGDTVSALNTDTGELIAYKTAYGLVSPARMITITSEITAAAIAAGYTVKSEG